MTRTTLLLTALLLTTTPLFSQTEKSANPLPTQNSKPNTQNSTRAVVVGISDYREPLIPDLKYADRDARAFADWLRSPAGLALPDSSIQLLLNQHATNAQMIVSLDWLIEQSQPGDRAFIYFSGHGDVERVSKFQRGFLLGHDSPPAVYGAGAFSLGYLQDILSTLSEKNVQVFVITDACRAGKLAGNSVGGAQATSTQLSQQFANEIKVLSCQPDEFSLEGEQWGGGRGCFSFHLEDALYGFADANADESVDLLELRRYLEDHVNAEAAPQSQTPMVSGPLKTRISTFRESDVTARRATKDAHPAAFRDIENRGIETLLLAKTDSSLQWLYAQFLAALDSGQLMSPAGRSADDYFKILISKPELATLHGVMKRKLAASLMDEGQTIINKVLRADPQVLDNIFANRVKYDHLPAYFERAAEILGEKHYAWRDLKAKEFYFRAMTVRPENYPDRQRDWSDLEKRRLLEKSLEWDSTSAVVFLQLGQTYPRRSKDGTAWLKKAVEVAPDWAVAHLCLGQSFTNPWEAIPFFKKALELDPTFLAPCYSIAHQFDKLGLRDSASFWRQKYIDKFDKRFAEDTASLKSVECEYMGLILWRHREFERAKAFLQRGEKLSEGKTTMIYGSLAVVNVDMLDFENALDDCRKRGWSDGEAVIYFYFLNDTTKASAAWAKEVGVRSIHPSIQAWLTMGNYSKAHFFAKKNLFLSETYLTRLFYTAESARLMGLEDTARHYYNRVIENENLELTETWIGAYPNYLVVALTLSRLGKTNALQKLLGAASEKLNSDPFHHFGLACFHAQTGDEKAAIASLQKAIELGWQPNPLIWLHGTLCDPMLSPICESESFKKLVREHFPKYYDIATRVPGRY